MSHRKLAALGVLGVLAVPSGAGASTGGIEAQSEASSSGEDMRSYVVGAHSKRFGLGDSPLGASLNAEVLIDGRRRSLVIEDGFAWSVGDSTYVELEQGAMQGPVSVFERAYHGKHRVTVIVRWSA